MLLKFSVTQSAALTRASETISSFLFALFCNISLMRIERLDHLHESLLGPGLRHDMTDPCAAAPKQLGASAGQICVDKQLQFISVRL